MQIFVNIYNLYKVDNIAIQSGEVPSHRDVIKTACRLLEFTLLLRCVTQFRVRTNILPLTSSTRNTSVLFYWFQTFTDVLSLKYPRINQCQWYSGWVIYFRWGEEMLGALKMLRCPEWPNTIFFTFHAQIEII